MTAQLLSAADGFVVAMLAMMLLSVGFIAMLIFCGLRNAARRDREVDELLDEITREVERKKHAPTKRNGPKPEPWERDGDWWKK